MANNPQAWAFPDAFVGRATVNAYEPYPVVSSTVFSSNAPASVEFVPWVQPAPVAVSNIVLAVSMNASVPQASSQNSSGSEGYTYGATAFLFSRQDYSANSSNLSFIASASLGITASESYSSSSQSYGLSWVTNTTGGVANFTTTSNGAAGGNWSSFGTGAKLISIPFVTQLTAGEYFIGFQHSSTAATSGSSVVLHSFSKLQQQWPVVSVGTLGGSASVAWMNPDGQGCGVASAITTNATMPITVISASAQPLIYFVMSNA